MKYNEDYELELERLAEEEAAYEAHRASCEPPFGEGYDYPEPPPRESLTNARMSNRGRHEPRTETTHQVGHVNAFADVLDMCEAIDDVHLTGATSGKRIVSTVAALLESEESYNYEFKAWRTPEET